MFARFNLIKTEKNFPTIWSSNPTLFGAQHDFSNLRDESGKNPAGFGRSVKYPAKNLRKDLLAILTHYRHKSDKNESRAKNREFRWRHKLKNRKEPQMLSFALKLLTTTRHVGGGYSSSGGELSSGATAAEGD